MMLENESKTHHARSELCLSRAPYRQGRKLLSVKVYTVSQESKYLLVQGVPAVGAHKNLIELFALYGTIDEYKLLDGYACEEFTDVFWIKYQHISSARIAKKKLDDYNFFGNTLHVCYVPEFETVDDTRQKLQQRRVGIARRLRELESENNTKNSPVVESSSSETTGENSSIIIKSDDCVSEAQSIEEKDSSTLVLISSDNSNSEVHNDEICKENQNDHFNRSSIDCQKYIDYKGSQLPNEVNENMIPCDKFTSVEVDRLSKNDNSSKLKKDLIIRKLDVKKSSTAFIPRQVAKSKKFTIRKSDTTEDVNEELKKTAVILGKIQGPNLNSTTDTQLNAFFTKDTYELSVEKSVQEIRDKVKRFSSVAIPHQVLKKKK